MQDELDLVAYCGLYCNDCFAHQGKIADLARDLRKELRQSRFEKTAEALSEISFFRVFENYPVCYEVLGAMVKFRCKKTCRTGGGPPHCKIRNCCIKKGIDGCWLCVEFEICEKLKFLEKGHGDGHIKNLRKLNKKGVDEFISGKRYWYSKPGEK